MFIEIGQSLNFYQIHLTEFKASQFALKCRHSEAHMNPATNYNEMVY